MNTDMKPKIIHTQTFSCDDDHPIVWYTFNNKVDSTDKTNKGYVVCEYCYTKFVYEPKKKLLPLKDHWIPGLTERPTQKDDRTPSEKLQDEIEPIPSYPCPMHEDYDDLESSDYVNKILKGSG